MTSDRINARINSHDDNRPRWQFGMRGMMAAGALIALWAAGVGTGHRMYLQGLFTVSWAVMLLSILALCFKPNARCFWSGFALFGWAYILLQFTNLFDDRTRGHFFSEVVGPALSQFLPEAGTEVSRGGLLYRWFVGTACKIAMILPVAFFGGVLSSWCFGSKEALPYEQNS